MLDVSSVTERFLLISGVAETDEKILALCQLSALRIQQMTVESEEQETDGRLINAAACDAFYHWTLINRATDTDSLKSFRAGDITVEGDAEAVCEAALKLRNEAFDSLKGLLCDNSFYFGEVLIDDIRPTF